LKLPRQRRIRRGHDFARLRASGQRVAGGCLIANWQALAPGTGGRLGVVTGRKVGNAVGRSRARRLLREVFRVHQGDLAAPVDLVLVARPSIAGKPFQAVERDFLNALRRAGLLKPGAGKCHE
jgi:ribonuclease P protein component